MKLKNVKAGVRVELKKPCSNRSISVGATGTIVESDNEIPFVEWDDHDMYAVCCEKLRKVKETSQ